MNIERVLTKSLTWSDYYQRVGDNRVYMMCGSFVSWKFPAYAGVVDIKVSISSQAFKGSKMVELVYVGKSKLTWTPKYCYLKNGGTRELYEPASKLLIKQFGTNLNRIFIKIEPV